MENNSHVTGRYTIIAALIALFGIYLNHKLNDQKEEDKQQIEAIESDKSKDDKSKELKILKPKDEQPKNINTKVIEKKDKEVKRVKKDYQYGGKVSLSCDYKKHTVKEIFEGVWSGEINQNEPYPPNFGQRSTIGFKIELKHQKNNSFSGHSYYVTNDNRKREYVKITLSAKFNESGSKMTFSESKIIMQESKPCVKKYTLKLNTDEGSFYLSGKWEGKLCRPGCISLSKEQSPVDEVMNTIRQEMADWQKKGDYEKTEEFNNRVNAKTCQEKASKMRTASIVSIFSKSLDMSKAERSYDADEEKFTIKPEGFNPLFFSIPPQEAKSINENFRNVKFNTDFEISQSGKPLIESIKMTNPINMRTYEYQY